MKTKSDFEKYVRDKAKRSLTMKRMVTETWVFMLASILIAALLKHLNVFHFSVNIMAWIIIIAVIMMLVLGLAGLNLTTISHKKIDEEAEKHYKLEKKKLQTKVITSSDKIDLLYKEAMSISDQKKLKKISKRMDVLCKKSEPYEQLLAEL